MGSEVVQDLLWTEKYRPQNLNDIGLEAKDRKALQAYLDAGEIPHLLFIGPPGCGKTTLARILTNHLDCVVLPLNASKDRGIDVVREQIGTFVSAITMSRWNIPFLDEADKLTPDAQTALRNLMESYAERARFIITGNEGYRIIPAIQSRCQVFPLSVPPFKERARVLMNVLKAEGIIATPQVVLSYAEAYTDMRQLLMRAQRAYLENDKTLPLAQPPASLSGGQLLAAIERGIWADVRAVAQSEDFDAVRSLRDLFYSVKDDHPKVGFLRHTIAKGVHDCGYTPDPIVLFLGVAAECMLGLS
jgi:DNA polymerase III delta prime subunit